MVGDASIPLTVIASIPEVKSCRRALVARRAAQARLAGQDLYLTRDVSIVGPKTSCW